MAHGAALRVLVVDDEPLVRWSLREVLRAAGHTVASLSDADSAIRAVSQANVPFDVLVLDYGLPGRNGLDLMTELRRRSPSSGMVIVTDLDAADDALAAEVRRHGGAAIVMKPVDMSGIGDVVQAAARTASLSPRILRDAPVGAVRAPTQAPNAPRRATPR